MLLLLAAWALCFTGFAWREKALALGEPTFDRLTAGYSEEEAGELLRRMGERGRSLYAVTQLSLDVVFPVVYGLLFALVIVAVYPQPWSRWLLLAPLLAVAADLCENVTTATMAWRFTEGGPPPLARLASAFTVVKTWAIAAVLAILVVGLVVWAVKRLRRAAASRAARG